MSNRLPDFWPFKTEAEWREYEDLRARSFALHAQAHALFSQAWDELQVSRKEASGAKEGALS